MRLPSSKVMRKTYPTHCNTSWQYPRFKTLPASQSSTKPPFASAVLTQEQGLAIALASELCISQCQGDNAALTCRGPERTFTMGS